MARREVGRALKVGALMRSVRISLKTARALLASSGNRSFSTEVSSFETLGSLKGDVWNI